MGVSRAAVAVAIEIVSHGVDWSPVHGGVCPCCGRKKCRVVTVRPWQDGLRLRYHACKCGHRFKSLQEDE